MPAGFFGGLFGRRPVATRPAFAPTRPVATPVARPVATPARKPVATPEPIHLSREGVPTGRRATKQVPLLPGTLPMLLAGTLTYVTSSLVRYFKYDRQRRELTVGFLSHFYGGAVIVYENVSEGEAIAAFTGASKGGFVLDFLWGPLIPGTRRHVGLKPWRRA